MSAVIQKLRDLVYQVPHTDDTSQLRNALYQLECIENGSDKDQSNSIDQATRFLGDFANSNYHDNYVKADARGIRADLASEYNDIKLVD
jgi:hypothetical protein